MVAQDGKSGDPFSNFMFYLPGTMNICFKFHSNTSDVCQNIQFKSKNVDHIMEEKSRDHQSQYNSSSREYERLYNIPCQYTEMSMRYWHYCVAKTTKLTYLAHKTPWTVSPRVCVLLLGKAGEPFLPGKKLEKKLFKDSTPSSDR